MGLKARQKRGRVMWASLSWAGYVAVWRTKREAMAEPCGVHAPLFDIPPSCWPGKVPTLGEVKRVRVVIEEVGDE